MSLEVRSSSSRTTLQELLSELALTQLKVSLDMLSVATILASDFFTAQSQLMSMIGREVTREKEQQVYLAEVFQRQTREIFRGPRANLRIVWSRKP